MSDAVEDHKGNVCINKIALMIGLKGTKRTGRQRKSGDRQHKVSSMLGKSVTAIDKKMMKTHWRDVICVARPSR